MLPARPELDAETTSTGLTLHVACPRLKDDHQRTSAAY